MAKYKIKHTSIMHNKTVYGEGAEIELTDVQATRLQDFVELIPAVAPVVKPKTQTAIAKPTNNKVETKKVLKAEVKTETPVEAKTETAKTKKTEGGETDVE